jgi:tRNA G37 N-methylase Trm5
MFSWGNITEKLRIASFDCSNETVIDLFAGIGYFTLVYLIKAKAKQVIACEWNPASVESLKNNLKLNNCEDRCIVLEGDNKKVYKNPHLICKQRNKK